jgi:hypothetical protein
MRSRLRVPDPRGPDAHAAGRAFTLLVLGAPRGPEVEPSVTLPITRSIT